MIQINIIQLTPNPEPLTSYPESDLAIIAASKELRRASCLVYETRQELKMLDKKYLQLVQITYASDLGLPEFESKKEELRQQLNLTKQRLSELESSELEALEAWQSAVDNA